MLQGQFCPLEGHVLLEDDGEPLKCNLQIQFLRVKVVLKYIYQPCMLLQQLDIFGYWSKKSVNPNIKTAQQLGSIYTCSVVILVLIIYCY